MHSLQRGKWRGLCAVTAQCQAQHDLRADRFQSYFLARKVRRNYFPHVSTVMWPSPHLLHTQASESVFIQTVCALRFFYETTLGRPWMVEYIPYPKKPKTLPVILSRDEVKALLLAPRHLKHRVILATLYATGVRVSALCQRQGTDIDSQRMVIHVRQGKGKRDRFVMLSPDLLPLLRRYWKLYQLRSWLFPGHRVTEPITRDGVAYICTQAGHAAKITKAVYPHVFRHNAA
jgi:integrase/recombinase XerD